MIEHFERQSVWTQPPIRDNWMTRMLGIFKDERYCFGKIPSDGIIARREGKDD